MPSCASWDEEARGGSPREIDGLPEQVELGASAGIVV